MIASTALRFALAALRACITLTRRAIWTTTMTRPAQRELALSTLRELHQCEVSLCADLARAIDADQTRRRRVA